MLRLNLSADPKWVDLGPGVRAKVRPVTTTLIAAARRDPEVAKLNPETASQDELGTAMSRAIARRAIVEWEGVGDVEGNPVPVLDTWITALMDRWEIFEQFQLKVMAPAMVVDQEKNGFAPLPNGTSAGAANTAPAAKGSAKRARRKSTPRKR